MGDIAKVAGISRQAVYLHFASRARLPAMDTDEAAAWNARMRALRGGCRAAIEALHADARLATGRRSTPPVRCGPCCWSQQSAGSPPPVGAASWPRSMRSDPYQATAQGLMRVPNCGGSDLRGQEPAPTSRRSAVARQSLSDRRDAGAPTGEAHALERRRPAGMGNPASRRATVQALSCSQAERLCKNPL